MRKLLFLTLMGFGLSLLLPDPRAAAEKPSPKETVRYQAVVVSYTGMQGNRETEPIVLILDTQQGHLWVWREMGMPTDPQGARMLVQGLYYQGKLRPGKKAGDIIESTSPWYKPESKEK